MPKPLINWFLRNKIFTWSQIIIPEIINLKGGKKFLLKWKNLAVTTLTRWLNLVSLIMKQAYIICLLYWPGSSNMSVRKDKKGKGIMKCDNQCYMWSLDPEMHSYKRKSRWRNLNMAYIDITVSMLNFLRVTIGTAVSRMPLFSRDLKYSGVMCWDSQHFFLSF